MKKPITMEKFIKVKTKQGELTLSTYWNKKLEKLYVRQK
jgi:hypothetical protein